MWILVKDKENIVQMIYFRTSSYIALHFSLVAPTFIFWLMHRLSSNGDNPATTPTRISTSKTQRKQHPTTAVIICLLYSQQIKGNVDLNQIIELLLDIAPSSRITNHRAPRSHMVENL